jgi:hypothetical protein
MLYLIIGSYTFKLASAISCNSSAAEDMSCGMWTLWRLERTS